MKEKDLNLILILKKSVILMYFIWVQQAVSATSSWWHYFRSWQWGWEDYAELKCCPEYYAVKTILSEFIPNLICLYQNTTTPVIYSIVESTGCFNKNYQIEKAKFSHKFVHFTKFKRYLWSRKTMLSPVVLHIIAFHYS